MKGLIALDIDGTITSEMTVTPPTVVEFLHRLIEEGWIIVFVTGRTFHMGYEVLKFFDFPYYYAIQNGSVILSMPEKRVVGCRYLHRDILPEAERIAAEEGVGIIVYCGYELSDQCYFQPHRFNLELQNYLKKRCEVFREIWNPVKTFDEMPHVDFPVIKCFNTEEVATRVAEKIEAELGLNAPVIRDPFDPRYYLMQATSAGVHKGQALKDIKELMRYEGIVIAAGDDNNDIPMFHEAHISIAMENAPEKVRQMADVIAPSADQEGIIIGLNKALKMVQEWK